MLQAAILYRKLLKLTWSPGAPAAPHLKYRGGFTDIWFYKFFHLFFLQCCLSFLCRNFIVDISLVIVLWSIILYILTC